MNLMFFKFKFWHFIILKQKVMEFLHIQLYHLKMIEKLLIF